MQTSLAFILLLTNRQRGQAVNCWKPEPPVGAGHRAELVNSGPLHLSCTHSFPDHLSLSFIHSFSSHLLNP